MEGQQEARVPLLDLVSEKRRTYASTVEGTSRDNRIKQRRAWLLLGCVTAERSCPCKQPSCPAIGGGSEKPLVPR
ncbi:hypothetical protein J6590_061385 [Homalodisca vitripennis]|nr:hypothetical protein J6590_061385 [Homalodisca vitripennis]